MTNYNNNTTKQSGVLAVIYLFLTSVNLLLPLLLAVLFSYLTCTFSGFPYKSEAARLRMRRVSQRKGVLHMSRDTETEQPGWRER